MPIDRHHRQSLLLGEAATQRLRASRVVLLGMGALGCTAADHLVRAGVGHLLLVDRDIVERTNLQRQTLFDESDAARGLPKVEAAARRLRAIDAAVSLEPIAVDVDSGNIESLLRRADLIIDGSDNVELRYLVNDVSVKHGLPWVMGGVLRTEGRVASFRGREGPCLRCLFPSPPSPGELATCDTAGVLGPAVGVVASFQAADAMKLLVGDLPGNSPVAMTLTTIDVWRTRVHTIDLAGAKREDCPCCGRRLFEFLDRPATGGAKLCGRNAMQVRPPAGSPRVDLTTLARRLAPIATIDAMDLMLKLVLHERPDLSMNLFGDGRMIVFGTNDPSVARTMYARIIGM